MSQQAFESEHRATWRELDGMLDALDAKRPLQDPALFPPLYRRICQHLALARHRHYGQALVAELNLLATRGYRHLYGARAEARLHWADAVGAFPRALREDGRMFLLSLALFLVPALGVFAAVLWHPEWVYDLLDLETIGNFEEMYDPASRSTRGERGSDSDLLMFGFYIYNNVGIAFRTFASGIFAGVGSAVLLLFNGYFLGIIAAHVHNEGFGQTFWPFVVGHGAFELTAIVIAGQAGMRLGWAVLAPGRLRRAQALAAAARRAMPLLYGMSVMLILAAFVEAFWSSAASVPPSVKYAVGGGLWLLVVLYLGFGGRAREA